MRDIGWQKLGHEGNSEAARLELTHARIVVYHTENAVAPLFHVIIWTNTSEHGRAA